GCYTDVSSDMSTADAAVSAAENAAATNSGTFADYDDAVTLSASSGMLTVHYDDASHTSGTWDWSGTGDEDSPYSVTITVTNADRSEERREGNGGWREG